MFASSFSVSKSFYHTFMAAWAPHSFMAFLLAFAAKMSWPLLALLVTCLIALDLRLEVVVVVVVPPVTQLRPTICHLLCRVRYFY